MRGFRRQFSVLLCMMVMATISVGCRPSSTMNDAAEVSQKTPVVVVGSSWYGHLPVWAGIERGFFDQLDFDVEFRVIGKSMDRVNTVSGGTAQFASIGEIAMLGAMSHDNDRFYWVGNQDIAPGFEGLVAQPGIDSIGELRGKKIGLPFASSVDLTCRSLLKQHGLDPEEDVQLINLEVGDVPAAFRNGNVDAALVWEPGFSKLQEVQGATVLGKDTDTEIYKKFSTMTGPDVLIIGRQWADEDPARARRFLGAYFLALQWVKDHPDEAVDVAVPKYVQQEREAFASNLAKFHWQTLDDQRRVMTDDGIFGQADFVGEMLCDDIGTIPKTPEFRHWVKLDLLPETLPSTSP